MADFDYFLDISVAESILQHCDNLSQTLQHNEMSAAKRQSVVALSLQCLKKLRKDRIFSLFWCKVTDRASSLGVEEPHLPRRCKVPRRYEDGSAQAT